MKRLYLTRAQCQHIADYNPSLVREAREWALECEWQDGEEIENMSAWRIVRGVDRNFEGGWQSFVDSAVETAIANILGG